MVAAEAMLENPLLGRGGGLWPPGWVFGEAYNPPQRLRDRSRCGACPSQEGIQNSSCLGLNTLPHAIVRGRSSLIRKIQAESQFSHGANSASFKTRSQSEVGNRQSPKLPFSPFELPSQYIEEVLIARFDQLESNCRFTNAYSVFPFQSETNLAVDCEVDRLLDCL